MALVDTTISIVVRILTKLNVRFHHVFHALRYTTSLVLADAATSIIFSGIPGGFLTFMISIVVSTASKRAINGSNEGEDVSGGGNESPTSFWMSVAARNLVLLPCMASLCLFLVDGVLNLWPGVGTPLGDTTRLCLQEEAASARADFGEGGANKKVFARCVVMSDTHNALSHTSPSVKDVPPGDVFIHCGDITKYGTRAELEAFNEWLDMLPHKIKIVIPGNHDLFADPKSKLWFKNANGERRERNVANVDENRTIDDTRKVLTHCTHYLVDEGAEIEIFPSSSADSARPAARPLVVYGNPVTTRIQGSGYNAFGSSEAEQVKNGSWSKLLEFCGVATSKNISPPAKKRLDILLTHTPPRNVRDRIVVIGPNVGSRPLNSVLAALSEAGVAPKLHCFGHIHEGRGVQLGPTLIETSPQLDRDMLGRPSCDSEKEGRNRGVHHQETHEHSKLPASSTKKTLVDTTFINAASVNLVHELRPGQHQAIVFDVDITAKEQ